MDIQLINHTIQSSNELSQNTNNTSHNNSSSILKQSFTQCTSKENIKEGSYFAGSIKPSRFKNYLKIMKLK